MISIRFQPPFCFLEFFDNFLSILEFNTLFTSLIKKLSNLVLNVSDFFIEIIRLFLKFFYFLNLLLLVFFWLDQIGFKMM